MGDASSKIRICLLGDCRVATPDGHDITPRSKKSRAILAYLGLSPSGKEAREKLRSLVWSNRGEKQARDSLRQTLATLRRELRDRDGAELVLADREEVSLRLDRLWIDAREAQRLAVSGSSDDWQRMPELCKGELLAGLEIEDPAFADWLLVERTRCHDQLRSTLERLLDDRIEQADIEAAAEAARLLLTVDNAHEKAHRILMQVYAARGDTASALRQYQILKSSLARELDVAPSRETEDLFSDLKERKTPVPHVERGRGKQRGAVSKSGIETPIAVLPFDNRSGDELGSALSETITQGLVAALSRFRWLLVIGQGATRGLVDQKADILEIGRRLQVDYILDGSVLRSGQHTKIAVELIQCATARTIWADQFTGDIAETNDAEERFASQIAARLDPEIRLAEISRASRTPLEEADPQDCVLRAIPLIYRMTPETFSEADRLLKSAIDMDPMYSSAYAWRGFWQLVNIGQQWADDVPAAVEEIEWLTRVAIEHDPEDAMAIALRGHVESFIKHDFQQALYYFDRALKLNPNLAFAWAFSAVTYCYLGDTVEALRRLDRYRELAPFDPYPFYFDTAFCIAHAFAGDYEAAVAVGRKVLSGNPNYFAAYRPLIASLGHLDRLDEARPLLAKLLENEPHFTTGWLRTKYPPLAGELLERYIEGLRLAGVRDS